MTGTLTSTPNSAIARLDWDSRHFDLHVAQLADSALGDDALAGQLQQAREQGVQLLVWPTDAGRELSRELLAEFGGQLVDQKATFRRPLTNEPPTSDRPRDGQPRVVEYAEATASSHLVDLAIAAGAFSRFRLDARFPRQKFHDMYQVWIERSVRHELADVVLVATSADRTDGPLDGMITLDETNGEANIGLVAVAAEMRGCGVGSALLRASHAWMRSRGANRAKVVTQLANRPACQLYESAGYLLAEVKHIYHFWLSPRA